MMQRIKKIEDLLAETARLKKQGKTIVFTNGCFDLLTATHIKFLEETKKLGDILIVGLNSDSSIRRIKGEKRPIINQEERAITLAALSCVDYVIIFDDTIPINLISEIKPDIYTKGGDYSKKHMLEHEGGIVEKYGGKLVILETKGRSTTSTIAKIVEVYQQDENDIRIFKAIKKILEKNAVTKKEIFEALKKMQKTRILLIGDFIVDKYTFCRAIGKTSKTPTISVKVGETKRFWGGAGLFAKHLAGLGAKVDFITIYGDDSEGRLIKKEQTKGLKKYFIMDKSRPTTIKERIIADGYKVLQLDTLENHYIDDKLFEKIKNKIKKLLQNCDIVLVSDPRHGIMSPKLIKFIKDICRAKNKILIADTQISNRTGNMSEYKGVDMLCANETEARAFLDDERTDIAGLAEKFAEKAEIKKFVLKMGEKGIIAIDKEACAFFEMPAIPVKAVDPIGAGDAFLSAASLTFKPEIPLIISMFIAVCAASLSITKMGTVANNTAELTEFVEKQVKKIYEN